MAKQTWNNPIDKSVDWGGDATTGNLPVSGEQVQKFIKETFDKKAGVFHYDNTNNRYLVFADASTRDEFLLDPTKTDLVLGTFDAPFNYTAEINLTSNAYNAVFLGSTGNYIDFTFDIKNKQGASTGENVTVTYTFIRNAVRQTVTETRKYGDVVHFNVDKYIGEGTNTVMVGVTGQTSLAATTVAITYQVVNLTIEDGLDISKSYSLQSGSQLVEVPFTVSGYGTKVVEWYLDGEMLPFVKVEDEVVDVIATRTKYITLSNLQQGTHSLQTRAYSLVNGEKFYTNTLYRDLLVYTGANSDVIIGVATTIPREYGVIGAGDSVAIYDMVQYVPYTLRFATYSPSNAASTEVTIKLDGVVKGVVGSANGVENEFVLTSTSSGNKILNLSTPSVSKDFNVLVKETDMNIQEIQSGLTLDFNAEGKTNNSPDRDTWSFGNYEGTLSGFNWNNSSGWVNGRLEMSAGSSFGINYAPLSGNPTSTGKTIEIEWATKNVTNDDAVICDLRGDNGVGILITATKVSMTSADGVTVETEYKSDENVRIGFVINKSSGTTNKQMSFIYTNGIVSRSEAWAVTDNYISDKTMLFTASAEAEVSLKAIRIYDAALTSDNMLNNYTLYRDTIEEMMAVYDRNDVYEEGTTVFSPEKMMNRLPVMIVTGDIPILENTSDKDTQIVVDIEYFNGDKSFTMKSAAMRPQGTSSMGYPKKNFRIYTQKVANTLLYDSKGNLVEDKLYSFKDGAQPVNCWCLKADYAESSGTHNTGIARLWNEALYNAQIDGEYKLRTEAQKAAEAVGYEYDVRTTIDGFPILLFYRPNANADLIFIGKYNFNNDKSTESVFGFKGIPNFDNSKMQCWEVLNNGNALALFTTADGFDAGWSEAFESRYPDTKTPYTGDLKAFCQWMSSVSQSAFATEKWEHLDVYKMAAYWCYLMRHAAADQFVKNAMFTSEDGVKFYYILYDNDTINGLINTGDIRIKPTDDRQTVDETGSYVFAGHDSRLWNMLEADDEFKDIVSAVDNALYSAGISYANTIRIFDEEQADKWVERVYNQDAQYKYVGPYAEKGINNLFMLQGKRDLHRRWWLAKRFSIYDAKYVSGTYKSQAVEIKCLNGTEAGQQFSIVAGYPLDYGYGINNVPREFGISLNVGDRYEFTTEEVVNLGDPVRVYGAPNIAELDFSKMSDRLAVVTIANVYDENLGTKLTKLILGNASKTNAEVTEISGLKQAASLEYLDIQGMTKMASVDLSEHIYLKTLKAFGSGISSATFAKGSPIERLELPSSMRVLNLNQHPYLTSENIAFENIANLAIVNVAACPNVSNDFGFVYNWFTSKTTANKSCSLIMDNVVWENVSPTEFLALCRLKLDGGVFQLKGRISIPSASVVVVNTIKAIFGETAFLPDAELYIEIPESLILEGPSRVVNGKSGTFVATAIPVAINQPTYHMIVNGEEVSSIAGVATLNANTGVLSVNADLAADTSVSVRAKFLGRDGVYIYSPIKEVAVAIEVRPTSIEIVGDDTIYYKDYTYTYNLNVLPANANVEYNVEWGLSENDYIEIVSSDNQSCVVKVKQETSLASFMQSLSATLVSVDGETTLSTYKQITLAQVVRPTSLVFDAGNEEVQFEGNYNYVVRPNITPINVSLAYDTPTLSGTAVSQGKVSLVSSANGTIVVKVNSESTEDLYFTIRQSATVSGGGATLEVVKQVTLVHVVRPTSVTIEGKNTITAGNHTYTAVLSPSTTNVPMTYAWSVSGSTNVTLEASNSESCVLVADTPDEDETFALTCTATSTDGKTTVSATFNGTLQTKPSFIVATYDVTSTTSTTQLVNSSYSLSFIKSMEIDGVEITPALSYTFDTTGEHTAIIKLANTLNANNNALLGLFQNCKRLTFLDFSSFNGATYLRYDSMCYGCSSLISVEWGECTFPNATNTTYAFRDCSKLESFSFSCFAGSMTQELGSSYFSGNTALTSIDFTGVAQSNLATITLAFTALTSVDFKPLEGAPNLTILTLSGCKNISEYRNMASIKKTPIKRLHLGGAFTEFDISDLAGSSLGSLRFTLANITSINLEPLRDVPLTSMQSMFHGCSKLTSVDLSPLAGKAITNLVDCFNGCSKLTSVDLSPLAGAPITSIAQAFYSCSALETVNFGGLKLQNVTSCKSCCFSCAKLKSFDWSVFEGNTNDIDMSNMMERCYILASVDLSSLRNAKSLKLNGLLKETKVVTIDFSPLKDVDILSLGFFSMSELTSIEWGECTFPKLTSLSQTFSSCSKLTHIDMSPFAGAQITSVKQIFYNCHALKTVDWGDCKFNLSSSDGSEGMYGYCDVLQEVDFTPFSDSTRMSFYTMFAGCAKLTTVDLSPLKNVAVSTFGNYAFSGCYVMSTLIVPWSTAPTATSSSFTNTGKNTAGSSKNKLIVPFDSTGYDSGYWLDPLQSTSGGNFKLEYGFEPQECLSLVIVAEDVSGRSTSTKISYTAIANGIDIFTGEAKSNIQVTGEGVSETFPQNTSTTDAVERVVSFTYLGVTATTTITQGVWIDQSYTVDLNSQWQESSTIANPDSATYDGVYESFSNKGIDNTAAIMYIDIVGYETFKFYVRSNAESKYDFVVVSNLDATLTNSTTSGTEVKLTTSNKQTSGTAISNYQLVEFTGIDGGEHRISVMYRKDSSSASGDDRGYVLIPKEQNW